MREGKGNGAIDAAAGAVAGVAARMVIAPLDVIKIRMQLCTRATHVGRVTGFGSLAEMGVLAVNIARKEGPLAFWAGNLPALKLYCAYSAVQFSTFGAIKRAAESSGFSAMAVGMVAGGAAGAVATAATFPLDVLRTRGAVLGHTRTEHTIHHTARSIVLAPVATVLDLYKGITPAIVQIVPYMGFNFAIYEGLQALTPSETLQLGSLTLYGATAGTVSKLLVYPLDLAKKRMQMQGVHMPSHHQEASGLRSVPVYRNLGHCLVTICREEGAAALFRGVVPSLVKAAPSSAAAFLGYEVAKSGLSQMIDTLSGNSPAHPPVQSAARPVPTHAAAAPSQRHLSRSSADCVPSGKPL